MPKVLYSSKFSDLHTAAADSASQGKTLVIDDDAALTETLAITEHVLSVPGVVISSPANPIIRVGTPGVHLSDKIIRLPALARTGIKWVDTLRVGTDIGLQAINLQRCELDFQSISQCSIGLSLEGRGAGNGASSNRIQGQLLWNNGVGFRAIADVGAWVSELRMDVNQWLLGNALGTAIAGTIHCDIQVINGNWHITGNAEGNAVEYMLRMNGNHGMFDLRWEVTTGVGTARAHFGPNAHRNVLVGHAVSNLMGNITTEYEGTRNRLVQSNVDGSRTDVLV